MSEAIKPTKGQAFVSRSGFATVYVDVRIGGGMLQEVAACGPTADGQDQQMANADLIAEAFNVATTHGLTPRQLVERVKELEEALQQMVEFFQPYAWGSSDNRKDALDNARAALSKALPNTVAEVKE